MKTKNVATTLILISIVSFVLILGCSKDKNPVSAFQPEISNIQNNFQFQATGLDNVTASVSYAWTNNGITANINQACAITSGHASLSILDSIGTEVYSGDLSQNGTFSSIEGASGSWTINVNLYGVSGTLNFRAQTP